MRSHPHLLEISAWPWLDQISRAEQRVVTLGDVPARWWDRIAADPVDVVFLMGVWRRSAVGRDIARTHPQLTAEYDRVLPGWTVDDVPGSPYSIQDYEPDARMGGWTGLDTARRELRARGIGLILDFVPNHTGFDHRWITSNPGRYILGSVSDHHRAPGDFRAVAHGGTTRYIACGRDPYFPPWTDVAQLNYFNPDTRAAMVGVLRSIREHCDGVRCDMAMLLLNDVFSRTWGAFLEEWPVPGEEFWPAATRTAPMLYVAEVYWDLQGTLLDQGFDVAYDKRLLDALHEPDPGPRIRQVLEGHVPPAHRLARFIDNHDEPRSAAALASRLQAAASLTATLPGVRFFFDGQFEGRRAKIPVQLGRWPDEPVNASIRAMYDRVLHFANARVLHDGDWALLPVVSAGDATFTNVIAYGWQAADSLALIAINVGDMTAQALVHPWRDARAADAFDFNDALTGASYAWTRESLDHGGLYIRLEPGQAHLFEVAPAR